MDILNQMNEKEITPNIRTFNTILRGTLRCGDINTSLQM